MKQHYSELNVCGSCVSDPVLGEQVRAEGRRSNCSFCEKNELVVSVEDLAHWVLPVYLQSVEMADDEIEHDDDSDRMYRRPGGHSPSDIIQELLGCEPELAEPLSQALKGLNWRTEQEGGETYFDDDQYGYVLSVPYSGKWLDAWTNFENEIKHHARFFNRSQQEFLHEIFTPLLRGDFNAGVPPFVTIGSDDADIPFIYRARDASHADLRERIYRNPVQELSAPPPNSRRQGRLNAAGISVLYACTDIHTAVAEVRVPVGGVAIVGKFTATRPLRLLDFRKFEVATPPVMSWFDAAFAERHAHVQFVRELHALIRRPILPDAEMLEYLPTQVLSEYLASLRHPQIDGLLLWSSLIRAPEEAGLPDFRGLNVILFSHASKVSGAEPLEVTRIHPSSADDSALSQLGLDNEIVEARPAAGSAQICHAADIKLQSVQPSLHLDRDGLHTVHVRGIQYDIKVSDVKFINSRWEKI